MTGQTNNDTPSVSNFVLTNERVDEGKYKFDVEISLTIPVDYFDTVLHFLVVTGSAANRREVYHTYASIGKPADPTRKGTARYKLPVELDENLLDSVGLRFEVSNTTEFKATEEGFIEVRDGVFFNSALPVELER
jgi:hypothetical protein